MKTFTILLLFLAQVALGDVDVLKRAHCKADNCARAVTGTVHGATRVTAARSDCSSFAAQTVQSLQVVPTYASACSGSIRYASACSCWGITASPPASVCSMKYSSRHLAGVDIRLQTTTSTTASTTTTTSSSTSTTPSGPGKFSSTKSILK